MAALGHDAVWIEVQESGDRRSAIRRACESIATIDYALDDITNQSPVCLGAIGVPPDTLKHALAVNQAKLNLKNVCAQLRGIRIRVPRKGASGTIAIQATRVLLRSIQRSDLNLLAAYRKIPILDAPPQSIAFTVARTRSVYRKTVDEVYELLVNREGPAAERDRGKLASLERRDAYLALVRERYANTRANVLYLRLDRRGRGRAQFAAELPLMFTMRKKDADPTIQFPAENGGAESARRIRQPLLEKLPLL